ncbi:SDR family NAD(P)-dependent oxidoreductase [soil metagenome]
MDLRWRIVVVTGAGGGLGREIAVRFARVGASVVAVDRDRSSAEETAELVRERRVKAWSLQADLTVDAEARLLADRARDLGGADVLVNNASGWTPGEQYPSAPVKGWSTTLALNLTAPMRLTQLFLEDLRHRRGRTDDPGAVVNIASRTGIGTAPYGSPEYAAAKAGLIRFTTAMSGPEVAARARITCLVPGWIGLPRAEVEWAALSSEEQAALPPLIPVSDDTGAVLDLASRAPAGTVRELPPR